MKKTISVGEQTFEVEGMMIPIDEIIPNPEQPRMQRILSADLRKSIMETKGLVQPLLVERVKGKDLKGLIEKAKDRYKNFGDSVIPEFLSSVKPKYLIIDGERRWANIVRILYENPEADYLKVLPCDVISESLSEKERYILWVSIHKMRKEWMAMEKETAARHLIRLMGDPASAANILGITVRQLQKLIEIYELAQRMTKGVGPRAISYARETMNLSKKLRTEEVINAIVDKVNKGLIKDPVDIRQLRKILVHPEAREEFLRPSGTIQSALAKVSAEEIPIKRPVGFRDAILQFKKVINAYSWREVQRWKGNSGLLKEIDDCIEILNQVKKALS